MAERNVSVKVRADVADFKRGMDEAGRSAEQLGTKAEQAGQKSKTGLSGMAQHVRDNRDAWTTTGGALTAYGIAVTGVAGLVGKVGIEYNTLRQTSTAALDTMLGGAKAAADQMDRLDEFATNSPFARQVFIEAQQQMLGFGVETEKVIPALDAIQNAVAAMGGSNDQIAALAEIMARIKSEGRLSGDALQRMGYYGIDAAAMIGQQMGLTALEIREMAARPGGIPVDQIWDPLVNGMQEKFGGAAANVKETFAGAIDRVRAAFRDLSSSAMEIFVDPTGGGLAVDGLNALADAMRRFESMPDGLRNALLGLGGLSGVASLAAGSFFLLAPRLVDTWDALGRMGPAGQRAQDGLRALPGIGAEMARAFGPLAAAGILAQIGHQLHDFARSAEEMDQVALSIQRGGDALAVFTDQSADVGTTRDNLETLINASWWDRPIAPLENIAIGLGKLIGQDVRSDITRTSEEMAEFADALGRMDAEQAVETFSQWADSMGLTREQVADLLTEMPGYTDMLRRVATEAGMVVTDQDLLNIALGRTQIVAEDAATELSTLVDVMRSGPDHLALMREGASQLAGSIQEAADQFINLSENINDSEVSLDEWLDGIIEQANARDAWAQNMETLLSEGLDLALYNALIEQGPAGALRVQQMVDDLAAGRDVSEFNVLGERMGSEVVDGAAASIAESQFPTVEFEAKLDRTTLHRDMLGLNRELEELPPATLNMDVDASAAYLEANLWTDTANDMWGTANLDADPIRANVQIQEWNALAGRTVGMPMLDADPAQARKQLNDWQRLATGTTGVPLIDANPSLAQSVLASWKARADTTQGWAQLHAIDYATGVLNGFLNRIPRSVSIAVNALPGPLSALGAFFPVRAEGGPINRASGGPVHGPGGPRDDLVAAYNVQSGQPYRLSNDEHVWTAAETAAVGGHAEMYRLRKAALAGAVRFDIGGAVSAAYASRQQQWAAPHVTAPVMQAAPVTVSLAGARITGRLALDGDGFGTLVDARIAADHDHARYDSRMVGAR